MFEQEPPASMCMFVCMHVGRRGQFIMHTGGFTMPKMAAI